MQATVIKNEEGIVTVRVRRSSAVNILWLHHKDLTVGDKVEVRRVVNNPYLVRV